MYLGDHALKTPDKPAIIQAATGQVITYRTLDHRSNQFAQFLYASGLRPGDHIALCMENNPRYLEICWAAIRSGLYVTAINRYLTADEAAYIVNDCGAQVLVMSHALSDVAVAVAPKLERCRIRLMVDGVAGDWPSYEQSIASCPTRRLAQESMGDTMLYSSGTTGRPKGIKRPLSGLPVGEGYRHRDALARYGFTDHTVYLSPAPLYHAAPLAFVLGTHFFGGTAIVMEKFDPLEALRLIERHRVTHSQWVPTMFVRMLKLPQSERRAFDLSSHRVAIHAAAPCPVDVKRRMIEWWGPILVEYYAGTEGNGSTLITSEEWLRHPGSVGRAALGVLHICDDAGCDLPAGEPGLIYFEREAMPFVYHNDPDKTRAAQHPVHPNWSTLGDVGYLDAEGYLYLTDRKAFTIISGGVNIYPQEIENALVMHPKVADVAVFGIPNEDLGEEVKAVIEPAAGIEPTSELARELIDFAHERLARYMVPRSIDFIERMPRLPTGKLYKRVLRDPYWQAATTGARVS